MWEDKFVGAESECGWVCGDNEEVVVWGGVYICVEELILFDEKGVDGQFGEERGVYKYICQCLLCVKDE